MSKQTFSEKWWDELLSSRQDEAHRFAPHARVFSEMQVRAIVVEAIQRNNDAWLAEGAKKP